MSGSKTTIEMKFIHFLCLICGLVGAIVAVAFWGGRIDRSVEVLATNVDKLTVKIDDHISTPTATVDCPTCSGVALKSK